MADVADSIADQDTEGAVSSVTQRLKDPASALMPKVTQSSVVDPAQSLMNKVIKQHDMKVKAGKKLLQQPGD